MDIVSAMTGPTTMNRVIHGAVRRDLARLESALAAAPDGDRARAGELQVEAVERQLRPSSLAESGRFMAWVQDGMPDDERAYLHSTIPRPVTFLLSRLAGRSHYRDVAPAWQPTR